MPTTSEFRRVIEERCIPVPHAGCWLWLSATTASGYGQLTFRRRHYAAHRLSYEAFKGPIPSGMYVMHSCDTPCCVNPDHLSVGSAADNNHDKQRKGRGARMLSAEAVRDIRQSRACAADMAKKYGVSASMVKKVRTRTNWTHVEGGGENRNPQKMNYVAACIARHLYRRGWRIREVASVFETSKGYMQHIISRRRWTTLATQEPTRG